MKIFLVIFAALAISACSSTSSNNAGYMNHTSTAAGVISEPKNKKR
ncbi:hypothetical protein [Vibrio celticus]|uniref:Lipoprotein n=1 Tax=Vibrio celticus TaxID=446372 RepID=A0A1C3J9F5_9VIBR|nr:hypothetical protein [Vibrio celticus]SBT11778.1 hypothetical protein VCE7224_00507 [Vibrio celticus]